ncbi:MAG: hypothetical protein Q4G52_12445 [Clostridia bacterium]|nr:hypothetical protein [Clostridia bacterium]
MDLDNPQEQERESGRQPRAEQQRPMCREQPGGESIAQAKRIIDLLEQKIGGGYKVPLRKDAVVVGASELIDLIGQLRIALPKTVQQAQNILLSSQSLVEEAKKKADEIANQAEKSARSVTQQAESFRSDVQKQADEYDKKVRSKAQQDAEAIIADANMRAEQIIFGAQQQAQKLVEENEITRRAQAYAMETRERAEKDADSIYNQACVHTDKMLSGAAAALSRSAGELAALRDSLLGQGTPVDR